MLFRNTVFFVLVICLSACSGDRDGRTGGEEEFLKVIDNAALKIDSGFADKALSYIDSASRSREELSPIERFDYYKFYCSYYLHYTRRYDLARAYADSMLRLAAGQKDRGDWVMRLAEANYSVGDVLFEQKKYAEAYKYFYLAKQIGKKSVNSCAQGDYSYRMGMILYKQGRYMPAKSYFIKSFEESRACKFDFSSFYRRQELLANAALCFTRLGNADSALFYYRKTLRLIDENDGRFPEKGLFYEQARGVVYGNQGVIYQLKGDFWLAEKLFRKSIEINARPNYDNNDAAYVRLHLASLLLEQHRLAEMKEQLDEVVRNLKILPNPDADLQLRALLWKYDSQKNDNEGAFKHLLSYNRLKDSIDKTTRDLTTADASQQLDNLEKQYEIVYLKKDKEINDLYFRILIVIALLCLAVIWLIYQNWKRSKNNVAGLKGLNVKVTEQKLKLEQTLAELERQAREKDRILRAVAHDLRNPIGGVASLSSLLLEDSHSEEHQEMIGLIQATCNDALLLINELLEMSGNDTVEEPVREVVDVNVKLINAIELLRFKAAEKKQELVFAGLPAPALVLASREKLMRVVSNLISNAIKFSPIGGKILITAERVAENIRVSVSDKGIGIPESIKSKIFDTFTEAKRSGTAGEKPFGLGLSISKQIMESLGGRIWFENAAGGGSIFYIELSEYNSLSSRFHASGGTQE